MKKFFLLPAFLFLSLNLIAQFPAPTDFVYSYDYILVGSTGICNNQTLVGPAYCDHFEWTVPDTSGTTATLSHYNIYYSDLNNSNVTLIASPTDTPYEMEGGIIGNIWVTAVYTNPDGESEPSNIETNTDLPLSVNKTDNPYTFNLYYQPDSQSILVFTNNKLDNIYVCDLNGRLVKAQNGNKKLISVSNLQKGIYIIGIEINRQINNQKIIIY